MQKKGIRIEWKFLKEVALDNITKRKEEKITDLIKEILVLLDYFWL